MYDEAFEDMDDETVRLLAVEAAEIVEATGLALDVVEAWQVTEEGLTRRETMVPHACGCCGTLEEYLDGPKGSFFLGSFSAPF